MHDDDFFKVLWDENTRIIGIDWKEATSAMTDDQFKAELTLFAGQVEQKKAQGILVEVSRFRHRPGPDVTPWRVKNISPRYTAAGVRRFAFLFPEGEIPPMMNQSSPGENFLTQAFASREQALTWLGGAGGERCHSRSLLSHWLAERKRTLADLLLLLAYVPEDHATLPRT